MTDAPDGRPALRQALHPLTVATHGKGLVEITREVLAWTADQGISTGLLTLWCRHTSASCSNVARDGYTNR